MENNKTKTVVMSLEQAQELYKNEPSLRSWLEENFDKKDLKPFHYTDIKTFEDACEKLGITTEINISSGLKELIVPTVALYKLQVIFKAINNGWIPDWNNSNEYKYYPWFTMSSDSFGSSVFSDWSAGSVSGSRLCTYNSEVSDYIGKQFESLYREAFLIK
jgi:hypothetical protein